MSTWFYRSQQFAVSLSQPLQRRFQPTTISGANSVLRIPTILQQHHVERVLVVTTPGFIRRKSLDPLFNALTAAGVNYAYFADVKPDPDIACIEACLQAATNQRAQALIAVGGGSVMDCAKVTGARLVRPRQSIQSMTGTMKIHRPLPLLIAVPTTAGSGSEVSAGAVITDTQTHRKYPIDDLFLIPKVAILDPQLLTGLPAKMTAYSGMDTLTHAIEAYTNKFGSRSAREHASHAVSLVFGYLRATYQDPSNLGARERMLIASHDAGIAFSSAYVGYVHAISHGIGGRYHVPHGLANAVILPVVMAAFGDSVVPALAALGRTIGLTATDDAQCAHQFMAAVDRLRADLDLPDHLSQIQEADIPALAAGAAAEGNPQYPVPQIWDSTKFATVIDRVRLGKR